MPEITVQLPIVPGTKYRHRQTGGIYRIVCEARLWGSRERVVVFRGGILGESFSIRRERFLATLDGRRLFEPLIDAATTELRAFELFTLAEGEGYSFAGWDAWGLRDDFLAHFPDFENADPSDLLFAAIRWLERKQRDRDRSTRQ